MDNNEVINSQSLLENLTEERQHGTIIPTITSQRLTDEKYKFKQKVPRLQEQSFRRQVKKLNC